MTITIDATYEDGVLKPSQPLPLSEHAQVRITVESQMEAAEQSPNNEVPRWEQILELTRDLPPEAFARMPTDGASQHDHYIYGSPKRTDLRDKPE